MPKKLEQIDQEMPLMRASHSLRTPLVFDLTKSKQMEKITLAG